jgi:hypothetical protein
MKKCWLFWFLSDALQNTHFSIWGSSLLANLSAVQTLSLVKCQAPSLHLRNVQAFHIALANTLSIFSFCLKVSLVNWFGWKYSLASHDHLHRSSSCGCNWIELASPQISKTLWNMLIVITAAWFWKSTLSYRALYLFEHVRVSGSEKVWFVAATKTGFAKLSS